MTYSTAHIHQLLRLSSLSLSLLLLCNSLAMDDFYSLDDQHQQHQSGNRPSPRREVQLQGPRPTPLKVRKDSHKIKKPPLHGPPHQLHSQQEVQQYRPPVIIYTVSPKVIHTDVSEFMSTVQRLTGFSSSSSSSSSSHHHHVCVSPAARLATMDKAISSGINNTNNNSSSLEVVGSGVVEEMEMEMIAGAAVERRGGGVGGAGGGFSGILSPVPSSIPPISPNLFASPVAPWDPNSLAFLHDLSFSPIFQGNRNYIEGTMVPSPTSLFNTAPMTSPTLSFDLFNHFLDL
ncbi:hypothetical protein Sjap_021894 [Stephania japonica]|uniref:VQ domain-containing protein n=1 Tax=Stephania japonica TaxID=461633 RepID=A0AAP0EQZ2_9MAGN